MDRRRALAISAAVAATTVGAAAAIAANFGLLGFDEARTGHLGTLEAGRASQLTVEATTGSTAPAPTAPNVTVRYEDIYLPAPSSNTVPPASMAAPEGSATAPGAQPALSGEAGEHDTGGAERGEPEHEEDD